MRPVMRCADVHAQAGRCPRGRSWLASPAMLFLAALALSTHLASAALPTGAHIDAASIAALSAGQDVCGDDTHGSACLRVVACADVDRRLDCKAGDDPVFTPDLTKTETLMAFRAVLPLPAVPHPNVGTLKETRSRVVGSPAYLALPRAAAVYEKQKVHPEACVERYCKIPDALRALHPVEVAFPDSKKKVPPLPSPPLAPLPSCQREGLHGAMTPPLHAFRAQGNCSAKARACY